MLKPLGGDGAPFKAVGEWLVPLVTVEGHEVRKKEVNGQRTQQENHSQVSLPSSPGPLGHFKAAGRLVRGSEPQGGQGLGGPGTQGGPRTRPEMLCTEAGHQRGLVGRGASPASRARRCQPPETLQTQNKQRFGWQLFVAGLHQCNRTIPFYTAPREKVYIWWRLNLSLDIFNHVLYTQLTAVFIERVLSSFNLLPPN